MRGRLTLLGLVLAGVAMGQSPAAMSLDDLVGLSLRNHPKLQQAEFAVEAARGKAAQARLYPNPILTITGDELTDRTGPSGLWTPMVTQEIVVAKKRALDIAAACRDIDRATWLVAAQRTVSITAVRQAYFDLLTIQSRAEVQDELFHFADQSVSKAARLHAAGRVSRVDILQLEVDQERFRADAEAAHSEVPAAFRRLAAAVGATDLPQTKILGSLETPLPLYELEVTRRLVVDVHPEMFAAHVAVDKARLVLDRARIEPKPNVTVGTGYTWQGQNRSHDFAVSVAVPLPTWNRNQGNIMAARAMLGDAEREVSRVETELVDRLAMAYRDYSSASRKVGRYRDAVIPRAKELFQLAAQAEMAGQLDSLKVLEAQRSVAQARLEYVKSLGDAWKAAAAIAGLLLEESWPASTVQPPPLATNGQKRQ